MKRLTGLMMVLTLAAGMVTTADAKQERKEQPSAREAEDALEVVGGAHFPEKIKIKRISSVEVGETYYHVFEGKLDETGYHIIIFDNYNNYLGYYESGSPPCNYQMKGKIVVDSGDVNDDGDPIYLYIPISPEKGVLKQIVLGGVPTQFIVNPNFSPEAKEAGAPAEGTAGTPGAAAEEEGEAVPEFREWKIKYKGQELQVRAIYVKQTFAEVYLKAEASGRTKGFPITALSKEDREYIKQFK